MLVLLLPNQVMHYWDIIKEGIEGTLPPYVVHNEETMENVQMAFLLGSAQCWVYVDKTPKVKCVLTTKVVYDSFTGSQVFEIATMYAFYTITGDEWIEGFTTLSKYAIGRKCKKMIFYTNEEKLLLISRKFGFIPSYVYSELVLQE